MKKAFLFWVAAACFGLNATAQGVHLSTGDSLAFGFNGVGNCRMLEGLPGSVVYVDLGADTLGVGESLRLEMFENSSSESAIADQTYNPTTPEAFIGLYKAGAWLDFQGVVRISMLSGSVDVRQGDFFVFPDSLTQCESHVSVPEPGTLTLAILAGSVGALVAIRRKKRRAATVMKTSLVTLIMAVCCCLSAEAQGVHLKAGDSLSISFDRMDRCQPCPECLLGFSGADLFFGADVLDPGESIRLEMFENSLGDPPLAVATHTPTDAKRAVTVFSTSPYWQDFQGILRGTMLNGEVDVSYAHFWVGPDRQFTSCDTVVLVPEPSVILLATLSAVAVGALTAFKRVRFTRNRDRVRSSLPTQI